VHLRLLFVLGSLTVGPLGVLQILSWLPHLILLVREVNVGVLDAAE
jgi:hypothetical protein